MPDFKAPVKKQNKYYDLEYDRILIEQSVAKQYGIIPSKQASLHYSDWVKLVSGLMDDTPLGRIISIRAERDPKVIRSFDASQKQIRNEWHAFQRDKNGGDTRQAMENLQSMIKGLFGR